MILLSLGERRGYVVAAEAVLIVGSWTVKVVPSPTVEVAVMRPPWPLTMRWVIRHR